MIRKAAAMPRKAEGPPTTSRTARINVAYFVAACLAVAVGLFLFVSESPVSSAGDGGGMSGNRDVANPLPASPARALTEWRAKTQPRYLLKSGDEYLHWSGTKLTAHRADAWKGSANQSVAIRKSITLAAGCRLVRAA